MVVIKASVRMKKVRVNRTFCHQILEC
jgi:hypothetical protein